MFRFLVAATAAIALVPAAQAVDTFPVTIEHALGSTTIQAKPERVVTWGWSAQDVVIELGVAPVGMPFFNYGGGDDGILPWTEAAIAERGMAMPTVLPDTPEPPIEAIAALQPDVIIAPYSGLTQEEYDLLSNIAPVVAYKDTPWLIRWQDVADLTGRALGLSAEVDQLVADTEAYLKEQAAPYPELQGMVFANVVNRTDGQVAVRVQGDPRVQLFADIGMVPAVAAPEGALVPTGISYTLSYENFDKIPAEMLLSFFNDAKSAEDFFGMDLISLSPLVKKGAYTRFEGNELTMAVSGAVTPLSLRWGFPEVIKGVGEAARKAKQ